MESPPLHRFLASLGKVQHHVHTAVVGLCAVEEGGARKPDDLDISWTAVDLQGSAREARRFLLRATLVFAAEELGEYATQVLKYRGEEPPSDRADRLRRLGIVDPSYLGVAPVLVSQWRNRIIHRRSKARLLEVEEQGLTSQADAIKASFKNIEVTRLLQHFEGDQPTLKDVTVLLAMSIRFVRLIDITLPTPSSAHEVQKWLATLGLLAEVRRRENEARNGGNPDPRARAKQFLLTEAPTLAEAYYSMGTA